VTIHSKNWCSVKLVKDATKKLFSERIKKHVKCWNWYIEVKEDYNEK
jgi:hypothetical protein